MGTGGGCGQPLADTGEAEWQAGAPERPLRRARPGHRCRNRCGGSSEPLRGPPGRDCLGSALAAHPCTRWGVWAADTYLGVNTSLTVKGALVRLSGVPSKLGSTAAP